MRGNEAALFERAFGGAPTLFLPPPPLMLLLLLFLVGMLFRGEGVAVCCMLRGEARVGTVKSGSKREARGPRWSSSKSTCVYWCLCVCVGVYLSSSIFESGLKKGRFVAPRAEFDSHVQQQQRKREI